MTTGAVERFDPKAASAERLRSFAVEVRDQVERMDQAQLDECEATLVAVAKRLRQLGKDANEAERSRVMCLSRLGQLLGPGKRGRPEMSEDYDIKMSEDHDIMSRAQRDRRHRARLLAEYGEDVRAELDSGKPVSLNRMVKVCQRRRSNRTVPTLDRRYSVLYVDPPWRYDFASDETRQIENQYGTMPLEDIKDVEVPAADDAVLFFWATSPKLLDGLAVIKAWDFDYRTCMVWVKDKIGMGYYARQQHELLLIAKRGELPAPLPANRSSSVIHGDRTAHSAKPDSVYELIESMYPEYRGEDDTSSDLCELFARSKRPGWASWGNEVTEAA